jgi:hypothetical protein
MKCNVLKTALEWLLITSLVVSVVCFIQFLNRTRTLRNFQAELVKSQTMQNFVNSVAADCVKYSEHNPAINPLLESFGIKQGPGNPGAPAAKPTGK